MPAGFMADYPMPTARLTRPELLAYVGSLPAEVQAIFKAADGFAKEAADTLDDGFQVAAEILDVFCDHAKRRMAGSS